MTMYTEAAFPQHWAMAYGNLGLAWEKLAPVEDATANLTRAAECFVNAERGYMAVGLSQDAEKARRELTRVREALAGK